MVKNKKKILVQLYMIEIIIISMLQDKCTLIFITHLKIFFFLFYFFFWGGVLWQGTLLPKYFSRASCRDTLNLMPGGNLVIIELKGESF